MLPDIVYVVRPGEDNIELKYSLRSLKNLPHRNVYIVGYVPKWTENVIRSPRMQDDATKYLNTSYNILQACHIEELSDDFILMNDDFFIMEPIDSLPVYNRGPVDDVITHYKNHYNDSPYINGMIETKQFMLRLGLDNLLSYELHVPFMYNKQKLLNLFQMQQELGPELRAIHRRSFYGNYYKIGGQIIEDVKIARTEVYDFPSHVPFLSTLDDAFIYGHVGKHIKNMFPDKSEYERK